jgi:hypothetical protein
MGESFDAKSVHGSSVGDLGVLKAGSLDRILPQPLAGVPAVILGVRDAAPRRG